MTQTELLAMPPDLGKVPAPTPTVAFLWHGDRNIGGGEYGAWLLAQRLRPEYKPLLLYGDQNQLVDKYAEAGVEVVRVGFDPRLTLVYRDAVTRNPLRLAWYGWLSLRAVTGVVRVIRERGVTILHPVDNLSKLIGGIAARLAGIKLVTHCHDMLGSSLIDRVLLMFQVLLMHRVIANSRKTAQLFSFKGRPTRKVVTIYNGIDLSVFDPDRVEIARDVNWRWTEGRVRIGIIAMFDRVKGHRFLFDALVGLRSQGVEDWCCLVVGEGRDGAVLQQAVQRLRLSDWVMFLGYRLDIAQILKGIDILVIASEQESFGTAAVEAMAMRVPVIASNVGGLPEVIEDGRTGLLVPPSDPEALSAALGTLMRSQAMRAEMGASGRARVEKLFSVEENVRRTKAVYRQLLGVP